jgi:hypothetical protein
MYLDLHIDSFCRLQDYKVKHELMEGGRCGEESQALAAPNPGFKVEV